MINKSLKSKKDRKTLVNFLCKKSSKTGSIGQIIIGTILLGTIMSLFAFYPVSFYINPYLYFNSDRYTNIDNLRLKSIGHIQIKGNIKLGFNTLEVYWPISSDCGPVLKEIIQYDMFLKEIYIWIWGAKDCLCPQITGSVKYLIEIFIPFPGSWEIFCNGKPIVISL